MVITDISAQKKKGRYNLFVDNVFYSGVGEEALINKRKPGNPLAKYHNKKELTPIEQLEYKVALLERELLKKDGEIVRLKKSIELERGDVKRKWFSKSMLV